MGDGNGNRGDPWSLVVLGLAICLPALILLFYQVVH